MKNNYLTLILSWGCLLPLLILTNKTSAQIVSDTTLPNNSRVTPQSNVLLIEEGTLRGSNLFHSFREFSISFGNEAVFNNALNIQNIFSRVTGNNISHIDGIIRSNGAAHLFFLNPNGIIFGPHARLDIGGSFLATTANSVQFSDRSHFTTNTQSHPVLSISAPIGLGLENPGNIRVQGNGYNIVENILFSPFIRNENPGLELQQGRTLALVGGNVSLENGVITIEQGHVAIGAVEQGTVAIQPTRQGWRLDYSSSSVQSFSNITLEQLSLIDTSGLRGGSVQLQGKNVQLNNGGFVLVQNLGNEPSGNITVNATESLQLIGNILNPKAPNAVGRSSLTTETLGLGQSGDITISTPNLLVQDGAIIGTRTFSPAPGGHINIQATDIQVLDFSSIRPDFFSAIVALTGGSGSSGNLDLVTSNLLLTNGGILSTSTAGSGKGGALTINATESIQLIGAQPNLISQSAITTGTVSSGDAGPLTINTSNLLLQDGGRIGTSSFNQGQAGSLTINASQSITVSGTFPNAVNPSLIDSSANILDSPAQETFRIPATPSGDSGNIFLNTPLIKITDGGLVTVKNDGSGDAGNLLLNANTLVLDNKGIISASTLSGEGGNIFLNGENLQLRNNSEITATATGTGNGGNITINTDNLVTLEGSNITTNAFQGAGGNIEITTQGLFLSPDSQITASSELGVDGVVEIITPEVNPSSGLFELSSGLINTDQILAQSCFAPRREQQGSFLVTGKSGILMTPYTAIVEWETLSAPPPESTTNTYKPLLQAQSMIKLADGTIILSAMPTSFKAC